MNDSIDLLNGFGDLLEKEANARIKIAIELFIKLDKEFKAEILLMTGFEGEFSIEKIHDHFDILDLLDTLPNCIRRMEIHIINSSTTDIEVDKAMELYEKCDYEFKTEILYHSDIKNVTVENESTTEKLRESFKLALSTGVLGRFISIMEHHVKSKESVKGDIFEEKTGTRPIWSGETVAPEHERAGNA